MSVPHADDPYELICNPWKTTIAMPGGVVLGYGPGPGLASAIFWNRIGSLFSCHRSAVAMFHVFDVGNLHERLPLQLKSTWWVPNLTRAVYEAPGIRIEERRTALKAGLRSSLKVANTGDGQRELVLFFHGKVSPRPFFDYQPGQQPPQVECLFQPDLRRVKIIEPHPHHGLLQPVNSIQTVGLSHELVAMGFGQDDGDLQALWHDHGCLESLGLRMGQVGKRFHGGSAAFTHQHPLYYFAMRVSLRPGEMELASISAQFSTDEDGGEIPGRYDGSAPDEWQKYLREEVPQLDCDDESLRRYWYYVWYLLKANRTAPGKHIMHAFTAPSKHMYWGPWIWDGYFHVLGEMWLKDPAVAKDSIRAVLDMQFPNGFIPVCSGSQYRMCFHEDVEGYTSPSGGGYASYTECSLTDYRELEHPFEAAVDISNASAGSQPSPESSFVHNEKTQTPLITAATYEYVSLTGDHGFADEVIPQLWAFEEWLWRRRKDEHGRFVLWHGDESGWDNATRHYPVPARPFDVQVHCLLHRQALLGLLRMRRKDEAKYSAMVATLEERLELTSCSLATYYCDNDRWHYDLAGDGGEEQRKQIAASGLFALLTKITPEKVESCVNALSHERVFAAKYPIPTLANCDPDYAPHGWGWNGPVWLQVNYFTIVGLLQARQYDDVFKLWEQTKRLIVREGQPYSFELYDPETGTGLGCPDYSWQAMINHLIIRYFAGVRTQVLQPALPPEMDRLSISNLSGSISAVDLRRHDKKTHISVTYTTPALFTIRAQGLGDVTAVESCNQGFQCDGYYWKPPAGTKPAKHWEVVVTCR